MPVVEIDLTEEPQVKPEIRAALDLILGPPGRGAIAVCPGDPTDNAPRQAIFYANSLEGRNRYLRDALQWEAEGRNNFFNSVIWHEDALKVRRAPLVIDATIRPVKFPCLWVDMDKPASPQASEMFEELKYTRLVVVNSSGGVLPDGKPKRHIRIPLHEPLTDLDEFYTLNKWFTSVMGADSKFSPVAWLTLPGSTRFKSEYPGGKATTKIKVCSARLSWRAEGLRRAFEYHIPEPSVAAGTARDASDLVAEQVPLRGLPVEIKRMLKQPDTGDGTARYKQTSKLVKLCAEKGLTKEQALWVLEQHRPSMAKFGDARLPSQVHACWPEDAAQAKELADYGGTSSKRVSMAEIGATEYPPVVWAVPGLIAEGLNILAAPPKAGKSFMVLSMALTCAEGGKIFDSIEVEQRPVLYFALEDGHRRLKSRAYKLMGHTKFPADCFVQIKSEPDQVIPDMLEFLEEFQGRQPLVIIDTLGRARGDFGAKGENAYSADYAYMTTMKNAIDSHPGASLIMVHHTRKAESTDAFDKVSGSQGTNGGADATLVISRKRSTREAVLEVTGREVEENRYRMTFDDCIWAMDGESLQAAADEGETTLSVKQQETLEIVRNAGPDGICAKDVAEAMRSTSSAVSSFLGRLCSRGIVQKRARGVYVCRDVGIVGMAGQ